jgi:hypothetical protein
MKEKNMKISNMGFECVVRALEADKKVARDIWRDPKTRKPTAFLERSKDKNSLFFHYENGAVSTANINYEEIFAKDWYVVNDPEHFFNIFA